MKLPLKEEIKKQYADFFRALLNLFIFFPYYFSVLPILKTMFSPWKNLVFHRQKRGFNPGEWLSVKFSNLISRLIGFSLRVWLLVVFALIQSLYVILLPFLILIYTLLLPFILLAKSTYSEEKELEKLEQRFIKTHLADPKNLPFVKQWFSIYIKKRNKKWWHLDNLLAIPPYAKDWSKGFTPNLDNYTTDLTAPDYQKKIKNIFGRKKEFNLIERNLIKREKNNVLIVGEEGIGKHTILAGLAKRIYHGTSHPLLAYKRILLLNLEKMVARFHDQKKIEFFFEELLKEAILAENIILVIDNLDRYVVSQPGHIDLTIPLTTWGDTNKIQILSFATPYNYQRYINPNEKIKNLFFKIELNEITKEEARQILLAKALEYEKNYRLSITYRVINLILDQSQYYITNIPFPEKAIDLLESVFVFGSQNKIKKITADLVDKILAEVIRAPVDIDNQLQTKLAHLNQTISRHILEQSEAVAQIASGLQRAYLARGQRKKPLISFLFLGPTGVGKTETAKTISRIFMGKENKMIRLDMANFQQKKDEEKLLGSFDTGEPGYLSRAISKTPYNVLLIDEIEKSPPNIRNLFLTILDEAYFTNSQGKKVDCKNLIIVATSNAGARFLMEKGGRIDPAEFINYLQENNIFLPEFLDRFDKIVIFKPMTRRSILTIAQTKARSIIEQLSKRYRLKIKLDNQALATLIDQKYNLAFGARGLEKLLQTEIEETVAKQVINNQVPSSREIVINFG